MIVRLLQLLTAGVTLLVATGVQAQRDLPNPWYLAGGIGGAWYEHQRLSGAFGAVNAHIEPGYTLNGAIGRYIDDIRVIRLEAEFMFSDADIDRTTTNLSATGTVNNIAIMFNGIYDLRTNTGWVPYAGVGVGYSLVDLSDVGAGGVRLVDDSDSVFAWQLKAGVAYEFSTWMTVTVGYRFFNTDNLVFSDTTGARLTSEGTTSHSAEVGFRLHF